MKTTPHDAALYPLTLLYDASCPLCLIEMENLMARNQAGRLAFVDASAPNFDDTTWGTPRAELMRIIHAVRADGGVVTGVEVFRLAYDAVGLGWVTRPTEWPLLKPLAEFLYPILARNRYRFSARFSTLLFGIAKRRAAKRAAERAAQCKDGACHLPNEVRS